MIKGQESKKHIPLITSFLILLIGIIFWRGIWNLLDTYFLPNNYLLSNILCVIIPIIIGLILIKINGYSLNRE